MKKKSLVNRARSALSNIKTYPTFLCYALVPDTFFGTFIYQLIFNFLYPIDYIRRHFWLKNQLFSVSKNTNKIDNKKGYLIIKSQDDSKMNEVISLCKEILKTDPYLNGTSFNTKSFLRQKWLSPSEIKYKPIWELAVSPKLLAPIANYLGYIPILGSATLWYSPNEHFEPGRSQMYHLDGEDMRQVKVFILIDNCDLDTGPLTFIPAQKSRIIYDNLKAKGITEARNQKIEDEQIEHYCDKNEILRFTGSPGDMALVDTDNCYHYGSRPAKKPRYLLQLQYIGQHSRHQPAWGKCPSFEVKKNYESDPLGKIKIAVLGFAHLAFPKLRNYQQ